MEATRQERRLTVFTPIRSVQPRLSLEEAVGSERARELREVFHQAYARTFLHDLETKGNPDPDYVPDGVDVTGHGHRVGEVAYSLACAMGLSRERSVEVWSAGKLHDTGKVLQTIHLLKRDLTPDELGRIHDHQVQSALLVEGWCRVLQIPANIQLMERVCQTVRRHHHPETLEELIVHFADKYVAMTEPRDRPAKTPREAYQLILPQLKKPRYGKFERRVRASLAKALKSMLP